LITDIRSYETFSTLIKVLSPKSSTHFLPLLIKPLGLNNQAFQLGILLTFVIAVQVVMFVFYKKIFSG
jgi:hypothetical protein